MIGRLPPPGLDPVLGCCAGIKCDTFVYSVLLKPFGQPWSLSRAMEVYHMMKADSNQPCSVIFVRLFKASHWVHQRGAQDPNRSAF